MITVFQVASKPTDQGCCKNQHMRTFTITLINFNNLFYKESEHATFGRDASAAPPAAKPPNSSAVTAMSDQKSVQKNIPPLQVQNFIATEAIGEAEVTMPEDITA